MFDPRVAVLSLIEEGAPGARLEICSNTCSWHCSNTWS